MVMTTWLHYSDTTTVKNDDIKKLFTESKYLRENYIVKEVSWTERKWFKTVTHTRFDIYYKLVYDNSWIGDAQCISLPGGPSFNNTYAYLIGCINGYEDCSKKHIEGKV